MTHFATSPQTLTNFLSASDMVRLVQRLGLRACLAGVARQITADFQRWPEQGRRRQAYFDRRDRVRR